MGVNSIYAWLRGVRQGFNTDLSTPENRRRAAIYNFWFDHGIVRVLWTNLHQVAPGVYRSNHPSEAQFERLKKMGIRTVINLRGPGSNAPYLVEVETCERLGLRLESVALNSRWAPPRDRLQHLIALFRTVERPFVMHCKSGADRAGLASAIYLMTIEGEPVESARRMLSWRFVHFRWMKTGILDFLLDSYAASAAETGIGFEDWLATEYDAEELQAAFDATRR